MNPAMNPESHFIDSNGLKIHVICWGDPGKPPDRFNQISPIDLPGASHWLHHTARDAFRAAVGTFISAFPER